MNNIPIGVFDSGIGGITVLSDIIKILPNQKFIYFGDTENAPYGTKDSDTILKYSLNAADFLIQKGIKALVVACNTATSASIKQLRKRLSIPVIGMEPALKLAVDKGDGGAIAVMATALTIKEKKFNDLMENLSPKAKVIPIACSGLVEIIEAGEWEGDRIHGYLDEKFSDKDIEKITDIVLGCTHYIFIKKAVRDFFDNKINVVDGNEGTARQLKRVLISEGLYQENCKIRDFDDLPVEFYFSGGKDRPLNLYKDWLRENVSRDKPHL
ncbi:MAG: glutamate racemase [Deltaproteobacteria bacterium]